MSNPIDISAETFALCDKLGLDPRDTGEIILTPNKLTASVFLKNENGKYIDPATNQPAAKTVEFEVSTWPKESA